MAIITISREMGSYGTKIAKQLVKELNYEFLDKKFLERKLKDYGLSKDQIEHYDEKKPGFWEQFSADKSKYLHFLKTAIYNFSAKNNCLILGRGGQIILKDIPGVLHLRIISSKTSRIKRIMKEFSCEESHAENIIYYSDRDRSGFLKFFFNLSWDDPNLYHLVVNTEVLKKDIVVDIIKKCISSPVFKKEEKKIKKLLENLCLTQKVVTKIVYEKKIPVQMLEVDIENGKIVLEGTTNVKKAIDECTKAAKEIEGVKKVSNNIFFYPTIYGWI